MKVNLIMSSGASNATLTTWKFDAMVCTSLETLASNCGLNSFDEFDYFVTFVNHHSHMTL